MLTKAISSTSFNESLSKLGMTDIHVRGALKLQATRSYLIPKKKSIKIMKEISKNYLPIHF
jgi:hypothetical protein